MADASLEQLFERYRRDGDLDALAEVFDRSAPRLLRVAAHLTRDAAAAEDVVQATFLAAIEYAGRYGAGRELIPWLVGILTNKALLARERAERFFDPARMTPPAATDPTSDAELREFVAALDHALEQVPLAYRQVLRTHLAEGKGADEIARAVGRPAGTVRVQLHRGLKHLRRALPPGLALGGAVIVSAPRGLGSIRGAVLERARELAPSTFTAATATTVLGGILLTKKIAALTALALVALLGAWWLGRDARPAGGGHVVPAQPNEVAAPAMSSVAPSAAREPIGTHAEVVEAAPAASADPYGSLEIVLTWWDGTVAGGVRVGAWPMGERQPSQHAWYGTTDEFGHATVERIHTGTVSIGLDRSGQGFEEQVEVGSRTEAHLVVPRGIDVRGRVFDDESRPVAEASIWIGPELQPNVVDGQEIGASDQRGEFFVRSVDTSYGIFASASGFSPSLDARLSELSPDADGSTSIDLQLRKGTADLEGIVSGASGERIAGAWVRVQSQWSFPNERWPAIWVRTGGDGAFRIEGLHKGGVGVEVDAPGYPYWQGNTLLQLEQLNHFDVVLQRGFSVTGSVRDDSGAPLANATVSKQFEGFVTCRLWTVTDERGWFLLEQIPAGIALIEAAKRIDGRTSSNTKTFRGQPGDVLQWDSIANDDLLISGRAYDAQNHPLVGWTVTAIPRSNLPYPLLTTRTDDEGLFTIRGCPDVICDVHLFAPGERTPSRGRQSDVRAGTTGLNLIALDRELFMSHVSGRVVDGQGQPIARARVRLNGWHLEGHSSVLTDADGSFCSTGLGPDTYWASVSLDNESSFELDPVVLAAREERSLGEIRFPGRGGLELTIRREDGTPLERPRILAFQGHSAASLASEDGVTFRAERVVAGPRLLLAHSYNCASGVWNVDVRDGELTKLDVRVPAGVRRRIHFRVPEGEQVPQSLHVRVRDAHGDLVLEQEAYYESTKDGASSHRSLSAGFAPGKYTFEASSLEGWIASGELEVAGTETEDTPPIEVILAKR